MAAPSAGGLRLRPIQVKSNGGTEGEASSASAYDALPAEPVSPVGRLFQHNLLHCNILCVLGFRTPVDIQVLREVLRESLMRHKRFFCKVDVSGSRPKWVMAENVRIEDHVRFVETSEAGSLESFVSQLASKPPLEFSAPLWEAFVMNLPRSDSNGQCVFRIHHSMGDGTSLMSLLLACTRQVAQPDLLPSIPGQTRTVTNSDSSTSLEIIKKKSKPSKNIFEIIFQGILSFVLTNLYVAEFLGATLGVKDTQTAIKAEKPAEKGPHQIVITEPLPLHEISSIRKAVEGSTINDVVMATICGGLHLYLQSKGHSRWEKLRVRGLGLVNIRDAPGLQELDTMLKTKSNAPWGNMMGYVMVPMEVGPLENPLERVKKMKAILDKKKLSYEAVMSYLNGKAVSVTAGTKTISQLTYKVMTNTTMAISNMIGPAEEVSLGGYPISFIAPTVCGTPQSLTVHAQTYNGSLRIIALAAQDCVSDPEALKGFFQAAHNELYSAALAATTA